MKNKRPMLSAEKKKWAIAAGIFAVVSAVGIIAGTAVSSNKKGLAVKAEDKKEVVTTDLAKPDNLLDGPAAWQQQESAKVDQLMKEIEALKSNNKSAAPPGVPETGLPNLDPTQLKSLPPVPPGAITANGASIPMGQLDAPSVIQSIKLSQSARVNKINNVETTGIRPNINVVGDGGDVTYDFLRGNSNSNSRAKLNSTGTFSAQQSYVPSGSIFRAVLLGGLDAPTGGESQTANPHPVLMRVTDLAILPNHMRGRFRDCFITGTGYGDLSSERAMIRTEQLSCVSKEDGKAVDISLKGWVAGEDGKAGVRGRLVTKQGAVLQNAMIAGILGGLGTSFGNVASVTTNTSLGAVSSIPDSKQLQAAMGSGAGSALQKLADYYIKLADKMFPVVEVNSGREVNVILLKGFQIGEENAQ